MMVIGTPKNLDDVYPFCQYELNELFAGMDGAIKNGMPAEVPAAIPFGQLTRITGTLKRYHDLLVALTVLNEIIEARGSDESTDVVMDRARFRGVAKNASEVLSLPPPKQQRVIIPGSL